LDFSSENLVCSRFLKFFYELAKATASMKNLNLKTQQPEVFVTAEVNRSLKQ
jgi:hypothetical protein